MLTSSAFDMSRFNPVVGFYLVATREMVDPDNADRITFWQQSTLEEMYKKLTRDGHEDLSSAASAINPETERQAGSVFATATQQITDLFVGRFRREWRLLGSRVHAEPRRPGVSPRFPD